MIQPTQDMIEKVCILVVDDDAMVRTIVVEYLMSFGFIHVDEAKNGRAAIKGMLQDNKLYDIIISDWEMPGMDGLTLLKALRNDPLRAATKFIMVTSQSSQERFKISRAIKSRVDAYIVKPFRGEVLKTKIYEVMGWKLEKAKSA